MIKEGFSRKKKKTLEGVYFVRCFRNGILDEEYQIDAFVQSSSKMLTANIMQWVKRKAS